MSKLGMVSIPVVILNYNSALDCIKCVSSLKEQVNVLLEIVIVDNCSQENDRLQIKAFCQREGITFLQSEENRGYSAGNNIGLRYAAQRGFKYAVISNPDMEFPEADYFSKMVAKMEEDTSIVVVGSDIINAEGDHQNPMMVDSFWEEFAWPISVIKSFLGIEKKSVASTASSGYCSLLVGCCMVVKIDFLKSINFLDEGVFLYCEEPILTMQIKRAGKRLYYMAECTALHMHFKGSKGSLLKRFNVLCESRNYKNKYYSDYNSVAVFLLFLSSKVRIFLQNIIDKYFYSR